MKKLDSCDNMATVLHEMGLCYV